MKIRIPYKYFTCTHAHTVSDMKKETDFNMLSLTEPLEVYSCNLVIEGYKIGLRQPMEEILTYVLTRHGDSTEIKTLQAHVTSSTFEITDNG